MDHTAYTVTTAGTQGLLNLLPIYVDHMLRPASTDEGFVTEIHHVTGEGENKGVVYCEMQGRENSAESVAERACLGRCMTRRATRRRPVGFVITSGNWRTRPSSGTMRSSTGPRTCV